MRPLASAAGLVTASCLLLLHGCAKQDATDRKPTFATKGQVLVDGKPAAGVVVVLHPLNNPDSEVPRPQGKTGKDGTFFLATYTPRDGAPAGRYVVTFLWQEGEEGNNLLPAQYASPDTSGQRVEIKEGLNELPPFKLRK